MSDHAREFPRHVEEALEASAKLHADHYRDASRLQRAAERLTRIVGHPAFAVALTLMVAAWIGGNLAVARIGLRPLDAPPFPWLSGAVSLTALYTTVLILATARREDRLADQREQLTLELAILSERKTAKIIQLLEELRRDSPQVEDRVDEESAAMAQPSDPQAVAEAIKSTHADPMKS